MAYKAVQNWDSMQWDVVNIETGRLYAGERTEQDAKEIAERLNNK